MTIGLHYRLAPLPFPFLAEFIDFALIDAPKTLPCHTVSTIPKTLPWHIVFTTPKTLPCHTVSTTPKTLLIIIIIIIINEHFNVHTVNLKNVMLNYTYK